MTDGKKKTKRVGCPYCRAYHGGPCPYCRAYKNNFMNNRIPLTLNERRELLHEFHWPKSQFPKKKFVPGVGLKSECDYYKVPIYKDEVPLFLKNIK